jgi:hypothetical protein
LYFIKSKIMSAKLTILTVLLTLSQVPQALSQPPLQKLWECQTGLSVPESVIYDSSRDCIYVANIHGKSAEKDSLGYISRLSREGTLLDSAWVGGLHAPKGMAILGDLLYVADIDRVVAIDIPTGTVRYVYPAFGSNFLNDICLTASGKLFVSDTRHGRIYYLRSVSSYFDIHQIMGMTPDNFGHSMLLPWMEDTVLLRRVNGLWSSGDTLFAGTQGAIVAFPSADEPATHHIIADSTGFIDGLDRLDADWIYSDWSGNVYRHSPQGRILLLSTAEQKVNAADIDVVSDRRLLLVPTFFHNSVSAYSIPK